MIDSTDGFFLGVDKLMRVVGMLRTEMGVDKERAPFNRTEGVQQYE